MAQGQNVGYVRVSTVDQNTSRQLDGLELDRIFTDKASGKSTDRPQLKECLAYLREGDVLHVHSMDRLARNLGDLRGMVDELVRRGCTVHFHKEHVVFGNNAGPMERLLLGLLGAVAEFERDLILERQREGIAVARAKGVYKGRKRKLTADQVHEIRQQIADGIPKSDIAEAYGVSRPTLYEYLRNTPWPTEH